MNEAEIKKITPILTQHGYEYKSFLGKGSFSIVLLCKSQKYQQDFAVKRAHKHKLSKFEYKSLISLNHPNIIKLYDAFEDDEAQYLVIEYCPNGTIRKYAPFQYNKFVYYAKQILCALDYCHKNNIAHRDIKTDNIFLDQHNQIRLADFGMSREFNDNKKSNEKCGSLIFLAPEILHYYEVCPFKADIWALGITFFFMITGKYPFQGKSREEIKHQILLGEIDFESHEIDQRIQFLISKMTTKSAKSRLSAEKLMQLPIFTPVVSRRTSLVVEPGVKNFYTTKLKNNLPNTTLIRPIFDRNRYLTEDGENNNKEKKPTMDVLSYRQINVLPNIQRMASRTQSKPI